MTEKSMWDKILKAVEDHQKHLIEYHQALTELSYITELPSEEDALVLIEKARIAGCKFRIKQLIKKIKKNGTTKRF